jgi:hypothetical protein
LGWQVVPSAHALPDAVPGQQAKLATPQHWPVDALQLALASLNHVLQSESAAHLGVQ